MKGNLSLFFHLIYYYIFIFVFVGDSGISHNVRCVERTRILMNDAERGGSNLCLAAHAVY